MILVGGWVVLTILEPPTEKCQTATALQGSVLKLTKPPTVQNTFEYPMTFFSHINNINNIPIKL